MAKKYPLGGLIFPLDFKDPDYCEYGCPICRAARKGNSFASLFQKVELALTRGGCWWGRAREKKYGVPPEKSIPENQHDEQEK